MKMLLAAVGVAAVVASPALAQTIGPWQRTQSGYPYIYPPDNRAHSANPRDDVYDTRGRYVGSDPDPFIRDQLARGHGKS
jgi:hypothetical protein